MTNVGGVLMQVWLCYWASAAFCGAFFGTLTALAVRSIFRAVIGVIKKRG